jgi:hypothetical protein
MNEAHAHAPAGCRTPRYAAHSFNQPMRSIRRNGNIHQRAVTNRKRRRSRESSFTHIQQHSTVVARMVANIAAYIFAAQRHRHIRQQYRTYARTPSAFPMKFLVRELVS